MHFVHNMQKKAVTGRPQQGVGLLLLCLSFLESAIVIWKMVVKLVCVVQMVVCVCYA